MTRSTIEMPLSRGRRVVVGSLLVSGALLLSGCGGGPPSIPGLSAEAPPPAAPPAAPGGPVRVGLVLPMGAGGNGAAVAAALKNAAEMALAARADSGVQLIVKDDKGTPEGARQAAQEAIAEGADIILGPLFSPSVAAAGEVARAAGRPMIAFSTDAAVASKGVYLLSFMPETEVDRVVAYAISQGRKTFAALIPETTYGGVAQAEFQRAVERQGGRIVAIERFPADRIRMEAPITKIAQMLNPAKPQADALFMPGDGEILEAAEPYLTAAGFNPARVKPIGTGVWNDPRVFKLKSFQGGWFAAPDSTGYNGFAQNYRARYGQAPTRIATLSYDAMSLAVALGAQPQRYSEQMLTNAAGFNGTDGVFRFRPTGTNERGLAVLEVKSGGTAVVSPAPKTFGAGG